MILVELCAPARTVGKGLPVILSALNVISTVSAYTITTGLSARVRTVGQGLPVINRIHVVTVVRVSALSMVVEKATANVTHTTVEARVNTLIHARCQKPSANIEVYADHFVTAFHITSASLFRRRCLLVGFGRAAVSVSVEFYHSCGLFLL